MRLDIRDLLDGYWEEALSPRDCGTASPENIRRLTMKKIADRTTKKKPKRILIAACAAALVLATAAAAAHSGWSGFALTGELSRSEQNALAREGSTAVAGEVVEPDGTTHYLDAQGNETLVLSAEEAAVYEKQREAARVRQVQESTARLDVRTLELVPSGITELPVAADGAFADFMAGNGHMVVLYPEGEEGFALSAGEQVTVSLKAEETCILAFGMVRDGRMAETETNRARKQAHTFTVPEDGTYCFTLTYCSAGVDRFTDGSVTVEVARGR